MKDLKDKWERQQITFQKRTKERIVQLIKQSEWDMTIKEHISSIVKEYNDQNPHDRIRLLPE